MHFTTFTYIGTLLAFTRLATAGPIPDPVGSQASSELQTGQASERAAGRPTITYRVQAARSQSVKDAFRYAWNGYNRTGVFGNDEVNPVTGGSSNSRSVPLMS